MKRKKKHFILLFNVVLVFVTQTKLYGVKMRGQADPSKTRAVVQKNIKPIQQLHFFSKHVAVCLKPFIIIFYVFFCCCVLVYILLISYLFLLIFFSNLNYVYYIIIIIVIVIVVPCFKTSISV